MTQELLLEEIGEGLENEDDEALVIARENLSW